jgi:hypothetical protein
MSVFKETFSRALKVIPSDDCNVPSPNLLVESTNTDIDGDPLILIDTSTKFYSTVSKQYLVNVGDVVYCYDTNLAATIVSVKTQTSLILNADIFNGLIGVTYYIYQEGAQTGLGNTGAYLYMGGPQNEGDIHVTTIGGDDMLIGKITKPFFPIQVKKVWLTDTGIDIGDLYAVW